MAKGPAFLILPAILVVRAAAGPSSVEPAPDYAQIADVDQAAGRALLEQIRQTGLSGTHYFEFDLSLIPRRGDERVVPGRLWAGRNGPGPVLRIILDPGRADERRWLIQGGPHPSAWLRDGAAPARAAEPLEPLWVGSEITAFDLQLPFPFLYWPDEALLGVNRIHGRPANAFLFRPPADFAGRHPDIAGVRAFFDTQYNFPEQTEILGRDGRPLKTWTLVDAKEVAGTWIPREFDVRNDATRDKARLDVTGAAVNLPPSASLFDRERLSDSGNPPRPPGFVDFGG
jgi:hypothetical protein